ncbi:MAG: hypothetical protein ACHP9Y_04965 [Gammaproteobacteria bacterium]
MPYNFSYTSKEIAQLVDYWQFCRFFDMATKETIISLPQHELYRPGSRQICNPEALEKIKSALTLAYEKGLRNIGMICPFALRIQLAECALGVTDDPNWQIYPRFQMNYVNNTLLTQEKIWSEELFLAKLELKLQAQEKEICENLGFTDKVLLELLQYRDVKNVMDLPPHLRRLFSDGQGEGPETKEQTGR